jgi:flagellar basal-body rod protein FlgG
MRMTVISNNLANVNTTGFKRGRALFEEESALERAQVGGPHRNDGADRQTSHRRARVVATDKKVLRATS